MSPTVRAHMYDATERSVMMLPLEVTDQIVMVTVSV